MMELIQKPFLIKAVHYISFLQHPISVSPDTKYASKETRSLASRIHVTSFQVSFSSSTRREKIALLRPMQELCKKGGI